MDILEMIYLRSIDGLLMLLVAAKIGALLVLVFGTAIGAALAISLPLILASEASRFSYRNPNRHRRGFPWGRYVRYQVVAVSLWLLFYLMAWNVAPYLSTSAFSIPFK